MSELTAALVVVAAVLSLFSLWLATSVFHP